MNNTVNKLKGIELRVNYTSYKCFSIKKKQKSQHFQIVLCWVSGLKRTLHRNGGQEVTLQIPQGEEAHRRLFALCQNHLSTGKSIVKIHRKFRKLSFQVA